MIIIRNSLSGRFPISSSFVWFGGHLSHSFTCLGIPLSLHLVYIAEFGVAFLYSGSLWSSLFVEFPCCGWGWTVACQGFLVREACVGVLVGGAGFLLSEVQ